MSDCKPPAGAILFHADDGRLTGWSDPSEPGEIAADPRDPTFDGEARLTDAQMARDRRAETRYRLGEARRFGLLDRRPAWRPRAGVGARRSRAAGRGRRATRGTSSSRGDPGPGSAEPHRPRGRP